MPEQNLLVLGIYFLNHDKNLSQCRLFDRADNKKGQLLHEQIHKQIPPHLNKELILVPRKFSRYVETHHSTYLQYQLAQRIQNLPSDLELRLVLSFVIQSRDYY